RESDQWRIPDWDRYQVDTWVVTGTLLSERREAAAAEASQWDNKSNNFIAAIAVFAVVLFLFGLASTLGGIIRTGFVMLGLALALISLMWVVGTAASPVRHVGERQLSRFAQAEGAMWQSKYDDAIQGFSDVLAADRDYANAYSERGYAYLKSEPPKLVEAVKDLQSALAKGNTKYEVYWNLGWAYYLAGDYKNSVSFSEKALDVNAKVCGPAFNVALARLASGDANATQKAYESAIARCETILNESLKEGLGAPYSLWTSMQGAANDIEDLICQSEQQYCYANRDKPNMAKVNRDAVNTLGQKYWKRVKEALTSLEYYHTSKVESNGAQVNSLKFGSRVVDEQGKFQSYIMRERFPDDRRDLYALFTYSGLSKDKPTVWKVFHNGREETGMRYDEPWTLSDEGTAQKKLNYRFIMLPGRYDVEIYAQGVLLARGGFDIDEEAPLPVELPSDARPSANVSVGGVVFADDFANNNHGWWSGTIDEADRGRIADGEYTIKTDVQDSRWRTTCEYCGEQSDIYYEATTRYVGGPSDWGYGLAVRADRAFENGYLFDINADGSYTIGRLNSGKYTSLADWIASSAIRKRGQNRLGVLARGSTLEFFINGQSVKRVSDASLAKGYFGMPLAGGTELLGRKDTTIRAVVDLRDLALDDVREAQGRLHIGAMTTLQTLVEHPAVRGFGDGLLSRAAQVSAAYTERVSATVGGTVVVGRANHDLLAALLVTDAAVTAHSLSGPLLIPLPRWLDERAHKQSGAIIVTEIEIPAQPAGARFAFERVSRTPRDRAIVNVAARARLDGEVVRDVRVVAGGIAATCMRLTAIEHVLEGQSVHALLPDMAELAQVIAAPPSDHMASSEYRRAMVAVLLLRCLMQLQAQTSTQTGTYA
ncbi:MAG: FAD binding domain-containing protein, partial [Chloroflexi bacterium]|nr:FAD binding domain-containing protein [Chloroflexota bacterium]